MFIQRRDVTTIDFDGLEIRDYTAGSDFGSSLAEIRVPVGVAHKPSWSTRSDKYYYVVEGRVVFTVNDRELELSPGDVCVVPRGDRFLYKNEGDREARLVLVHTPSFHLDAERFED